ncbi:MAG: TrkH family potassium uptake protein [Candidatus Marinimicrobia bacterium]|nr:TrkH family potassium uptake protein [Candidatus Neomarinimicrobiota bacterium]
MLFSAAWSLYYSEPDLWPILRSSGITFGVGLTVFFLTYSKKPKDLTPRDGFAIVTIGWIAMAGFSALPMFFATDLSYTNAYFEAMSGLTTTGASILGGSSTIEIESLPHGILFWRSFTHFIGGMGIIVFSLAILPMLGMGGVQLFRAEVAGPIADKLTPRVKQTAKLLWFIYVGFVAAETVILKMVGMNWFDSFCHAFGTMATGGFSTRNASAGAYSGTIQMVILLFMFLAATNFSLHYSSFSKRKFEYFKDREFKVYLILITIFTVLFFINTSSIYHWSLESLRHALFTSVSLLTTTGFGTIDFETWPSLSKMLVFFLFFIGGCAGSTTGGMKIIRSILITKYLVSEVRKLLHPKGVFPIKIGKKVIPDEVVKNTLGFYLFYIFIFVITSVVYSITGLDLETSLTAAASAIGNIGPGLGSIGPWENWAHLTDFAKWVSSFTMLMGRLEIFTVVVLFSRSFWRK